MFFFLVFKEDLASNTCTHTLERLNASRPVFIGDTHQVAKTQTRLSFCQMPNLLFAAPLSNNEGLEWFLCLSRVWFLSKSLSPGSLQTVTASVSRPRTEMDILVETFPSCLKWVRGGAIGQHRRDRRATRSQTDVTVCHTNIWLQTFAFETLKPVVTASACSLSFDLLMPQLF